MRTGISLLRDWISTMRCAREYCSRALQPVYLARVIQRVIEICVSVII